MVKRLLVVDDEANLLRAVAACLRAEGYEVHTCLTVRDALVLLSHTVPDLIISDIRMPGMDGYTFVRQLRDSARTALIPVIFLTAKDQKEDRIEGLRTGVDAYMTKPFEPDELLALITSIFSRLERTQSAIARLVGATATEKKAKIYEEILTDAECRIAEAVARGLSNKEIATEFEISVRTVENHISHILAKKNFSNRVEIARYIIEGEAGTPLNK
jgi:DNA-binding NarL/FixJ family response regulator